MLLSWDAGVLAGSQYRFAIIGAGPAGLYLAQQLSGAGRVLVVDAGDAGKPLGEGAGYYDLTVTGRPYPVLGSRLSALGGTSNHWGGNAQPLPPELFAPASGPNVWPIRYDDFAQHLPAAARFLNLAPVGDGPTTMEQGVLADYTDLQVSRFALSSPMARLGDAEHLAGFADLPGVDLLPATRLLDMSASGDRIAAITLRHRPSGESATLSPEVTVLATGGIENARLLLWAGRNLPAGNPLSGGPNGLTGAYFAEKPFFSPIDLFVDARANFDDALPHDGYRGYLAWEPSEAFRRRHDLPRLAIFPGGATPVQSNPDLVAMDAVYAQQSAGWLHLVPFFQFDQSAYRDSYVALDRSIADQDGMARAELHWQIAPEEIAGYRRAVLLMAGLLNQKGFARSRMRAEYLGEDWSDIDLGYCCHHVGTTRMAAQPADGVVDTDCRVFSTANLYVAGCSVFPSCGVQHPTLNLVALAGRLADHLKTEFAA